MRLFNPNTMTEVIPGFHDTAGAIELPADNWFFRTSEIPKGMRLDVNDQGEPVLLEIKNEMTEKCEVDAI